MTRKHLWLMENSQLNYITGLLTLFYGDRQTKRNYPMPDDNDIMK